MTNEIIDATARQLMRQLLSSTLLALTLFGCTGDDTGVEIEPEADTENGMVEGDAVRGEELFFACAACHGPDGAGGIDIGGTPSPDLRDEVPKMTDAELEDVIKNGDDAMPPVYDDPQDIADMVAYLRETF